jgi:hypothetical protein
MLRALRELHSAKQPTVRAAVCVRPRKAVVKGFAIPIPRPHMSGTHATRITPSACSQGRSTTASCSNTTLLTHVNLHSG